MFHAPGSFKPNPIAGYHSDSLKDGKSFSEVKEKFLEKIKGKLVVTVAGENDLRAMDIPLSNYEDAHFDLHLHFRKGNPNQITKSLNKNKQ